MDELAAAIAPLERARVVNYVSVASTALVAYDYIITFGDEVRLVWPAPWNIGKIMFFLTRYPIFADCALNLLAILAISCTLVAITFIASLTNPNTAQLCQPLYEAASWMCFLGIAIAEIIMAMRTYAIWGKNKWVGILLALLNIAVIIPDIILIQRAMESLVFMPTPFPTLAPCILIHADLTVFVDMVLIMVTEFIIVAMTFYKGYTQWRETKSTLVKTFLRDGLQYFACMFAISLANVFVFKLAVVDYSSLLLLLQRVLHSMLSGRILLELREAVQDTSDNGPKQNGDGVSKMSTMDFAPHDEKNRGRAPDGLSFDEGDEFSGDGVDGTGTRTTGLESEEGIRQDDIEAAFKLQMNKTNHDGRDALLSNSESSLHSTLNSRTESAKGKNKEQTTVV